MKNCILVVIAICVFCMKYTLSADSFSTRRRSLQFLFLKGETRMKNNGKMSRERRPVIYA